MPKCKRLKQRRDATGLVFREGLLMCECAYDCAQCDCFGHAFITLLKINIVC